MNYFILDTMPAAEKSYCILGEPPGSLLNFGYRMSRGIAMGSDYPKDPQWRMSDEFGGTRLPSLVGNTEGVLVVDRKLKEVFEGTGVAMECLSFILLNHKGRVASRDYFIINPLGNFDCLNLEESEIEWLDDEVVGIDKYVLDTDKMKDAPDVFRIKEEREQIVISHRLADELKKVNPTNVYLSKLEQAP